MCLTPTIPLTSRVYSAEDTWPTLFANERGGQSRQSVLVRKNKPRKPKRQVVATAVLDRCGNNWRNGKGGCGILMMKEVSPCMATMFLPFVLKECI